MSSSDPDTLHFSDMNSVSHSQRRRRFPSPDYGHRPSTHQRRSSSSGCDKTEMIRKLEAHNSRLMRENDLLKEQVKLKEENLRLHGVQIISDIVHLLDEHHIKCNAYDLSPPPQLATSDQENHEDVASETDRKSYSPYEQDIINEHRWMADLSQKRIKTPASAPHVVSGPKRRSTRSPTHRLHFSPSIDSIELEEALSKSASIGKPKYASTPYKRSDQKEKRAGMNCNVNGNHTSYNLRSPHTRNSIYFGNKEKTIKGLLEHWERCDHKHLHVGPSDPNRKDKERKPHQSVHIRTRSATDLNRTYTINTKPKIVHSARAPQQRSAKTSMTGDRSPAFKNTTFIQTGVHQKEVRWSPEKPESKAGHLRQSAENESRKTSSAINKLSLLESNHTRVLGEIAFQLDKRILSFVLNGKFNRNRRYKSFYGYTVLNLQQRVIERENGELKEVMLDRYNFLMSTLQSIGYVIPKHCNKAVTLVNKYGVMRQSAADVRSVVIGLEDEALLRGIARRIGTPDEIEDILTLLQCLAVMAADDGMPLFIW